MTEFETLLTECKGAAERFVRFKLSSRADADDLLQEIYLTAFEKFDTLKDRERFKPWLLTIARNKIRDYYRERAKGQEISIEELGVDFAPAGRFGLAEQRLVYAALNSLSETDRQMIHLFFMDGYRQEEIAARLNIPVGTVKSRIYTARKHFKEAYAPEIVKKAGAVIMSKMKLPEYLPEYTITPSKEAPFSVKWEELMGWFIVPKLGEKRSWAMYDFPQRKRTEWVELEVVGRAEVHGIEGVEVTAKEYSPGEEKNPSLRSFVAQLTDTHCRSLAESYMSGGVKKCLTFLDGDAFLSAWGFGEENCGNETNLTAKGDILRTGDTVTTKDKMFLLDVVGRYTVELDGKTYDTVCMMDIESDGSATEQYLDQNGRTILWRRFNRDDWAAESYQKPWTELLPENERITVNGVAYVHWYDCITDYVL